MINVTLEQAQKIREDAITLAARVHLPDKIMYLCLVDPGNITQGRDATESIYTRPLAGGGVFLRYYNKQNRAVAEDSERPGKLVFEAIQIMPPTTPPWKLLRFRRGVWFEKVIEEYARITFRKDNQAVIDILNDFATEDGSHA